jgi:hypothetical protein
MTVKNKPPDGQQFIWLTRELLMSDAWRSQGINTVRFIHFLLLEHLRHGGQENGKLKAPRRQLCAFGIGARHVSTAIAEAEKLGLVICHKRGMRTATLYRLTWLEGHDGKRAENGWQAYRNPELLPIRGLKSRNLTSLRIPGLVHEGKSDRPNLVSEGIPDAPQGLVHEGKPLLREIFPTGLTPGEPAGRAPSAAVLPLRRPGRTHHRREQ